MAVTTSSDQNGEFGDTTLTITYPSGAAGDVLLVWLVTDSAAAITGYSGDLTSGELLTSVSSTGRLRVYRRVRQSGDTGVVLTFGANVRASAAVANLTTDLDGSAPTTTGVFSSSGTVSPSGAPGGPGLLAVWWSYSEIDLDPVATLIEDPNAGGDVTTGMELRLYSIAEETDITQTAPTNPSLSLFIRAVSYTTIPETAAGRWRTGRVGWPA